MRTLKNGFGALILSIALFSCGNNDITNGSNNSSLATGGTLNGTIINYSAEVFDAIEFVDNQYNGISYGRCTPTADGKFSIKLSAPTTFKGDFSAISGVSGITISDPTTKYADAQAWVYKSNIGAGVLYKGNFMTLTSGSIPKGSTVSGLRYVDKNCTIKGSYSYDNTTLTFDLTLKKGWNEMVIIGLNSSTVSSLTTIPAGLQWRYFSGSENGN